MMLNPVIKLNVIEQWKLKNNMGNDFSINSRVESKIHRIISETVIHNIKDPRLKKISINEVRLSNDLGHAKIYCSMLDACLLYTSPSPRDVEESGIPCCW